MQAFKQELSLATHLSVPAMFLSLRSDNCTNLARCLNHFLLAPQNQTVSVLVGVCWWECAGGL